MSLLMTLEIHHSSFAKFARITASRSNAKFGVLHAFYAQPKQALGNAANLRQHACKGAFRAYWSGIAETSNPGLKNQKVLPGTFPIEGGGRTQVVLKSFRKSPGNIQHAIKRVLRGVTRSKVRKAKTLSVN